MTFRQASLAVSVVLLAAALGLATRFPPAAAGAGLYGLVAIALAASLQLKPSRGGRTRRRSVLLTLLALAACSLAAAWFWPPQGGALAILAFCLFLHAYLLTRRTGCLGGLAPAPVVPVRRPLSLY